MYESFRTFGRQLWMSLLLAGFLGAPMAVLATADGTPAAQKAEAPPSDADLANAQCAIGEERFLPADYYYCLATQNYGVQHYAYAQKFFTTAASWASKPAQYVLGIMALNGDHQPVNRPLALAWLALAAERPQSSFKLAYTSAYASATPAERQAAEKLLVTMRPTYADATAAVRSEKRYTQGMAQLERLNGHDGMYCMEGIVPFSALSGSDAVEATSQCPPVQVVANAIDQAAAGVFDGWIGHVSVGPLQPVSGPAAASHKTK
jgi:hypothetical protein